MSNSLWRDRGVRMDMRPQNSPATAAGMRGVHRGMRGNVIGGYTAEGQPLGTKRGLSSKPGAPATPAGFFEGTPPPAAAPIQTPPGSTATPAKKPSYRLQAMGGSAMRAIPDSPPPVAAAAAPTPALPQQMSVPAPPEQQKMMARRKGINPLTGMAFGVAPGDAGYDASWHDRYAATGTGKAPARPAPKPAAPSQTAPVVTPPVPAPAAPSPLAAAVGPVAPSPAQRLAPAKPSPTGSPFRALGPSLATTAAAMPAPDPIDPRLMESVQQRRARGYVSASPEEAAILDEMDLLNVENAKSREFKKGTMEEDPEHNRRTWARMREKMETDRRAAREVIERGALDESSESARFASQRKKEDALRAHEEKWNREFSGLDQLVAADEKRFKGRSEQLDKHYNTRRADLNRRLKGLRAK